MIELNTPKVNTREFIISKSAELFNLHGYNGCSMSDIMEATNLKKGGVYNYFKSKEEIAVEAFNYGYSKIIERFRSRLDYDKTATEKLFSIVEVYASFVEQPIMKGGCPIFNTAVDASDNNPVLKEKAQEGIARLLRYIEIKVEQGIEAGEFAPSSRPDIIASLIVMMMEGAIIMWRVDGDRGHMDRAVQFMREYIENCKA